MTELLQTIVGLLQSLWPLEKVNEWERGLKLRFGRIRGEVGPGVYFVWWWFEEVLTVSLVPAIINTGRQDITLADGSVVTYTVTATAQVVEPRRALTEVDDFRETTQELLTAVVADRLASVDLERLLPSGRKRLLSDLTRWVTAESEAFGVQVSNVRFASFVHRTKTLRVIMDREAGLTW